MNRREEYAKLLQELGQPVPALDGASVSYTHLDVYKRQVQIVTARLQIRDIQDFSDRIGVFARYKIA